MARMRAFAQKLAPYRDIIENVAILVVMFVGIMVVFQYFDLGDVQSFAARFGIFAPLVFVLTKAATIVFAPLSGSPLYPVAGALFGFWKGFVVLLAGDILGGSIAFWIARIYGIRITERFVKGESSLMKKILDHLGTLKGYVFARICFSPMPELVCYAAGLTQMSFLRFIVVHIIIDIPVTAILVGAGTLISFNFSPLIIFGLIIVGTLATVAGGVWFYKQVK